MKKQEIIEYYIVQIRERGLFRHSKLDYKSLKADWKDFVENLKMDDCITERQFEILTGENFPCREECFDVFVKRI